MVEDNDADVPVPDGWTALYDERRVTEGDLIWATHGQAETKLTVHCRDREENVVGIVGMDEHGLVVTTFGIMLPGVDVVTLDVLSGETVASVDQVTPDVDSYTTAASVYHTLCVMLGDRSRPCVTPECEYVQALGGLHVFSRAIEVAAISRFGIPA